MTTAIDERRAELGRLDLVPDAARWLAMPLAEIAKTGLPAKAS